MNNLVTITNKSYLLGTYVMFASLLKNGNVGEFDFYILHNKDFDIDEFIETLNNIAEKYNQKELINYYLLEIDFNVYGKNTLEFYKNALSKFSIFKLDLDEFVFLDSDLLILNDISELFNIEAGFAACKDTGAPTEINTGVMHIKREWLTDENFQFLMNSAKNNFSHRGDQEHINLLVNNRCQILPTVYNTLKDSHRFRGSWLSRVKILHYISKKPWQPYHPELHKQGNLECLDIDRLWMKQFDELGIEKYKLIKSREELVKHVAKECPEGYGVEVGVQEGKFSKIILDNWNCEKLFLVDPWEEYDEYQSDLGAVSQEQHEHNLNKTIANTFGYDDRVEIIRDYSVNASDEFHDESLDFVYLDARHDKDGIFEDIEAWWPKVSKGGILAGHDYTDLEQGINKIEVKSVVDEYFDEVNCTLDGPYPSWWIKKS